VALCLLASGCADVIDILDDLRDHGHGHGGGPACVPSRPRSAADADVRVDLDVEYQRIAGFGGINVPGWIPDLTAEQVDTAFGNGDGQIGMSILRVRVPYDSTQFELEVPAAARAVGLGATVIASPWSPPPEMKTSADPVGGELLPEFYGAYADHLLSFRDFMADNGVPLYAVSVQNEPDIQVTYESCDWTPEQLITWLQEQGPRFGRTKLIAAESFNFNRMITDPILNDPEAEAQVDIVGGHIYGNGLFDYPLARELGKEVWMTEHYTSSSISANAWPQALDVGKEISDVMSANFSAYIWWYIRRAYGPLTEDGLVSKRGEMLAQFAKFVRPGDVRIEATQPEAPDVSVTAFKDRKGQLALVAVNRGTEPVSLDVAISGGCAEELSVVTSSETKSLSADGTLPVLDGRVSVVLDAQSVTTFVGN
jgi:O-glycosyl hydrolase